MEKAAVMSGTSAPLAPGDSVNFVSHSLQRDGHQWRYRPTARAYCPLAVLRGLDYLCAVAGLSVAGVNIAVGLLAAAVGALFVWLGRQLLAQ